MSDQVPEPELASYRFKLRRLRGEELRIFLETLLKQNRLAESLESDIADAIARDSSHLSSELLSKVIAATRSKLIFEAGKATLNLGPGNWFRFVGLIDKVEVEERLCEILYDEGINQNPIYYPFILGALIERGSARSLEVIQVLLYELEPRLQSSNVLFGSIKDQINESGVPEEFGQVVINRRALEFYVEKLRDAFNRLRSRLDTKEKLAAATNHELYRAENQVSPAKTSSANETSSTDFSWGQPPVPDDVLSLIAQGEGPLLEFKSTLHISLHPNDKIPAEVIEGNVLKTIGAFLNSKGGVLLIGVADDGQILGIEEDRFSSFDEFQKHFSNLVRDKIGLQFSPWISAHVVPIQDRHVFFVECKPSDRHVHVELKGNKGPTFFIRMGSQTESLEGGKLGDYVISRFGDSRPTRE